MNAVTSSKVEVGIDTGGTFTDIVCFRNGILVGITKIPSTPSDPSLAIVEALAQMENDWGILPRDVERFCHGTTVTTNALIERKGGCVGLLATEGFTDGDEKHRHQEIRRDRF